DLTALDLGHAIEVFELIRQLAGEYRTVVMVVHDLTNACRFADHLVAMKHGRVLATGSPNEVVRSELVHELYGVHCDLMTDSGTDSPIMTNIRRSWKRHDARSHSLGTQSNARRTI